MSAPLVRKLGANARGYTYRWQQESKAFLAEDPLCIDCRKEGRIGVATVVDHEVPHRGDPSLFWARSNWRRRCKPHHDAKTAREDGGFGNLRRSSSERRGRAG